MLKIGITGGIGGGKSTFSQMLRERGFLVYNTDKEASILQNNNDQLITQIKKEFGNESYNSFGQLNRKYLASIVFNDYGRLSALNAIVHPFVKNDLIEWYEKNSGQSFLFVECAILFEGGFDQLVDKVLLVTASEDIRVKRVSERDKSLEKDVRLRMKQQLSEDDKSLKSDFVINTDNGLSNAIIDSFLLKLNELL
jgi:dephospho-CoA kinase